MKPGGRAAALATSALIAFGCAKSTSQLDTRQDTAVGDTGTVDADAPPDVPDVADTLEVGDARDTPVDGYRDTIGLPCSTDAECQNGLYCDGEEICPYGFCQAGERADCSDGVNCTLDTCIEETDTCEHEIDDAACDDSNPCTTDSCEVSSDTCIHEPIDCSDGVNCTLDTCDTTTGDCVHTIADEACDDMDACTTDSCDVPSDTCINTLIDGDGDTYAPESCGADDCDDTDSSIHPGAPEVCGDGIDQDCDGSDALLGTCTCPEAITADGVYTGTTSGTSLYRGLCGGSGPEWIYTFTTTGTGWVTFDTGGTLWDTVLYVRSGSCATGTEEGCDDDGGGGTTSRLRLRLGSGTYWLFVDAYSTLSYGAFTLDVSGL
jgi:hypothetical protein